MGKSHGLHGWQYIELYCSRQLSDYSPLLLMQQATSDVQSNLQVLPRDIALEDIKQSGGKFLAKLKGIMTPEEASALTNLLIGVKRESLPASQPKGTADYYWHDLMGARVISLYAGREIMLGTIVNMQRLPANDNMVVKSEQGKHHYIPFVSPDYVKEVQLQPADSLPTIKVNWDPDF